MRESICRDQSTLECCFGLVYELPVAMPAKICVVLIFIVSAQSCQAQCNRPSPLARRIDHFHVGEASSASLFECQPVDVFYAVLFRMGHFTLASIPLP